MTDGDLAMQHRVYHVEQFRPSPLSQRAYCRRERTPSRETLRRWERLYVRGGEKALRSRRPVRRPHNRTAPEDEARILDSVRDNPAHGPQRIANELAGQIAVGRTGVHGVLKRNGLNKRPARLEWARRQHGQVITKSELQRAREKANASMKQMLARPDLQLAEKPHVWLRYLAAKEKGEEDRIVWTVLYGFKAPRSFRGWRLECRVFDATTGEPLDESVLDE